jgi:hypothetical protein
MTLSCDHACNKTQQWQQPLKESAMVDEGLTLTMDI